MEEKTFKVVRIEGEYAYLRELGIDYDELFIAMALLPFGTDEGSVIRFNGFEYEIVE